MVRSSDGCGPARALAVRRPASPRARMVRSSDGCGPARALAVGRSAAATPSAPRPPRRRGRRPPAPPGRRRGRPSVAPASGAGASPPTRHGAPGRPALRWRPVVLGRARAILRSPARMLEHGPRVRGRAVGRECHVAGPRRCLMSPRGAAGADRRRDPGRSERTSADHRQPLGSRGARTAASGRRRIRRRRQLTRPLGTPGRHRRSGRSRSTWTAAQGPRCGPLGRLLPSGNSCGRAASLRVVGFGT